MDNLIAGSLNNLGNTLLMSEEEFQENFGISKPSNNVPLAVMCLLGIRAQTAQLAFMGAGYSNVRLYPGSFADWKVNKGEIELEEHEASL